MKAALADKRAALDGILRSMHGLVVAFSGGVDSTFLSAAGHEALGDGCLAVTAVSPSIARRELEGARRIASEQGWNHRVVTTHELGRERYAVNAPDRCYWCKSELFDVLGPIAASRGAEIAIGTVTDDLREHRPGLTAASERGVRQPLVEAGLSKEEVRALSRLLGLPTADKPASPCLASRLAYGVRVTSQGLRRIDRAEDALRALGFSELRVRDHGDLARIEVPQDEIEGAAARRSEISDALSELGFRYVTLDLVGFRSGSLNETIPAPRLRR
jgi:pyridinium-3,5-biscarboxylic acid mononucleotide sulfurtransferase